MTGSSPGTNQQQTLISPPGSQELYSRLYQASLELASATCKDDILLVLSGVLANARFPSLLLVVQQGKLSDEEVLVPFHSGIAESNHPYFVNKFAADQPVFRMAEIETSLLNDECADPKQADVAYRIVHADGADQNANPLLVFVQHLGLVSAAFIFVTRLKQLDCVLIMGSKQVKLTQDLLKPFIQLAALARSAFDRLHTLQTLEKRLVTLQALNVISQVVAQQADLDALYGVVHNQILQVFGEVTFFIAIYDAKTNMVSIPYLSEVGSEHAVQPPPFMLGVGLTSWVIQRREPLMLVEDTARRAQELGAQQAGLPAKSWMGVPMVVAGDVTGAIVIQDLFQEHRFDEDDLRMMVTMASQVAVAVRYVNLLRNAQMQAELERELNEITAKIRATTDPQQILQTAAREIARVVDARRTRFVLSPAGDEKVIEDL